MSVKWNGKRHTDELLSQLARNMTKAVRFAEGKAKKMVSRGNVSGKNPSSPGEPPKVVTGALRSSIDTEVSKDSLSVSGFLGVRKGIAQDYAFFLEFGTSRMAARPFLRPTIVNNKRSLLRIIGADR